MNGFNDQSSNACHANGMETERASAADLDAAGFGAKSLRTGHLTNKNMGMDMDMTSTSLLTHLQ